MSTPAIETTVDQGRPRRHGHSNNTSAPSAAGLVTCRRNGEGVAYAVCRARVRHDRRRRRDAAHRFRPVDHRMAAAARRYPAAQRGRLAGGVRQVQGRSPSTTSSTRACRSKTSSSSTGGSGATASSAASSALPSPCRSSLLADAAARGRASAVSISACWRWAACRARSAGTW